MNDRRDWKVAFIGNGSKRKVILDLLTKLTKEELEQIEVLVNEPSTNYLKRTRTKDNSN